MDTKSIEQTILSRQLPGLLPAEQGWVVPHYDGLSIANLAPTVTALFETPSSATLPALPRALWADWMPGLRRVVLVIVDALGLRLLEGMWAQGEGEVFRELADAGRLVPLTSVFPSTTDAALLSMRSGCAPAEHGWLAYEMYLRELGIAANAILLCPVWTRQGDLLVDWGLDPDALVSAPSLTGDLVAGGVETWALLANYLRSSGFTQMLYRGTDELRGHVGAGDFWVVLRHLLAETRGKRILLTAYWSDLDTLGHYYGPDTEQWAGAFRNLSHLLEREFLARLPAADREGTLFLLVADHGQIRIPAEQILVAQEDPALSQHLLVPVTGESRGAFLHPRPGRAGAIRAYLEEAYPGWFVVLDSVEALKAGLLGQPIADETYARAGELLVLPRGRHALQRAKIPVPLVGRHGGLTQGEMLVPLIGARLEAVAV
jgi:predicted AlkP superfamily pyrophosphatase or phosphodiesterase